MRSEGKSGFLLALASVQIGEIILYRFDVRMVSAQGFFHDFNRALAAIKS